MTTQTSNTLPLADIHLQNAPGIWPLAWGWWLVITVTLSVIIFFIIWYQMHTKKTCAQKEALQTLNSLTSLADINSLLKRAALSYFDREHVAGLTGNAWIHFLDDQQPVVGEDSFVAHESLWQKGSFSQEGLSDDEFRTCRALAVKWLKKALPPKTFHTFNNPKSTDRKKVNHV
ncbi:DUF4381 domain-containing protein [Candidatus Enterovibrio altilux]|uniref:DUF4381 domain-containing protein n=1 Tax=Candidatus Enterovibrio altilux TaxID=1927128 RepID=A0A291BBH0_9GAMM|nr:DUF4381 domain-containing protein [Candidatus Enterovibrio luxaltus]ATF10379.1 hypothetical protein BTN50_1964 [Candidatus Enterovibrio luxaltus]